MEHFADQELTRAIIGAAIHVHRHLGPGLLERSYAHCLARTLHKRGIPFEAEVGCSIEFEGETLRHGYRLDFLVADRVVVELKAVQEIHPIHRAQLLTYLRHANKRTGLLINFNVLILKDGLSRVLNPRAK